VLIALLSIDKDEDKETEIEETSIVYWGLNDSKWLLDVIDDQAVVDTEKKENLWWTTEEGWLSDLLWSTSQSEQNLNEQIDVISLSKGNKTLFNTNLDVIFWNFKITNNSDQNILINNISLISKYDKSWIDSIYVSINWKKYNINNLSLNLNYKLNYWESIIVILQWKVNSNYLWKIQMWINNINFKDLNNKFDKIKTNVLGYIYDIK
jgi:hypothetical protein